MTNKKFNTLMEEVTSRYQQGGILAGDLVTVKKEALKNSKLIDRPSNFMDQLKRVIETDLPVRVSAIKSERPETSNDLIGGVNNAATGFWVDVCIEYAPGLWRDPMTLPLEVLDLANNDPNLPEWPDEVKRDNNVSEKPEEIKPNSKDVNVLQTQGDERSYGSKNIKLPTGVTKDGRDQTKIKESIEDVYENIIKESSHGKKVKFTLFNNREYDEYIVKVWIDGKYSEAKSYFTDDKEDAKDTMQAMKKEYSGQGYEVTS